MLSCCCFCGSMLLYVRPSPCLKLLCPNDWQRISNPHRSLELHHSTSASMTSNKDLFFSSFFSGRFVRINLWGEQLIEPPLWQDLSDLCRPMRDMKHVCNACKHWSLSLSLLWYLFFLCYCLCHFPMHMQRVDLRNTNPKLWSNVFLCQGISYDIFSYLTIWLKSVSMPGHIFYPSLLFWSILPWWLIELRLCDLQDILS